MMHEYHAEGITNIQSDNLWNNHSGGSVLVEELINKSRRDVVMSATTAGAALAGVAVAGATVADTVSGKETGSPEFHNQCAFITGGARGIGFACAEEMARAGANIVLYDVAQPIKHIPYPLASVEDLQNAKSAIEAYGVRCMTVQGDVRDSHKIKQSMERAVREFGGLHHIIVNAGVTQIGVLDQLTDDEVQTVLDINLGGAIKTVQAALPYLREQKSGRILLMASVTGRVGSERFPVYSSTKWGVIGLTKSTALLMAKYNVTCNALCPTLVHTKLLDNEYILNAISPDNPKFEVFDGYAKGYHPMGVGLYDPIHVAKAARFFLGEASSLVSGEVFDIGAGYNAQLNA